jgi:hypothetical protein
MTGQFARSARVPCRTRGYHDTGTRTVRPSTSVTTSSSSVTLTSRASTSSVSIGEELIPSLEKTRRIVGYKPHYCTNLARAEATAALQSNGIDYRDPLEHRC